MSNYSAYHDKTMGDGGGGCMNFFVNYELSTPATMLHIYKYCRQFNLLYWYQTNQYCREVYGKGDNCSFIISPVSVELVLDNSDELCSSSDSLELEDSLATCTTGFFLFPKTFRLSPLDTAKNPLFLLLHKK